MIIDFYISLGLIVLLSSIFQLINFKEIFFTKEWYNKFILITKKKPKTQDFRTKSQQDLFVKNKILIIFDLIWISILLFTKFSYIGLSYILLNFVVNYIIVKLNYNITSKLIYFTLVFYKTLITFTVILEHFFMKLF